MALYNLHGVTITFGTSFFAQITSVRHTGLSRNKIDTTHSGTTGARTGIMSNLYEPGQYVIEGIHDNTKSFITQITASPENCTITKLASGQNTGGTVVASVGMSGYEYGGPCDDSPELCTFTATLDILDDITFTAGS
jgi:hypothetical protein